MSEAKKKSSPIEGLPAHVRERLDAFTQQLRQSLEDDLVGVLVHGSVARGEYNPAQSDVDVVVVVKQAKFKELEAIGNAVQLARYSARIEAMILAEDEIGGASDAFPLLYDDIRRFHVVVEGRDAFADVVVHDTHRRLRIEQELREASIRLRRAVTDAVGAREAVGGAVLRKIKQVRTPLHALLSLKGVECEPNLKSVIAKAAEVYDVEVKSLWAAREQPEKAHEALSELLRKATKDVDTMATSIDGAT
jgi:predicted nucleotidyltransferase